MHGNKFHILSGQRNKKPNSRRLRAKSAARNSETIQVSGS